MSSPGQTDNLENLYRGVLESGRKSGYAKYVNKLATCLPSALLFSPRSCHLLAEFRMRLAGI